MELGNLRLSEQLKGDIKIVKIVVAVERPRLDEASDEGQQDHPETEILHQEFEDRVSKQHGKVYITLDAIHFV